ncbi:acetylglutamate kinase n-acetyl-gamma-glutamyl-phosphate reductase precursor (ARG-6) [Fusarium subglutinans]|uniref:acetylglutamate kinase n=1 Tax=Gibberella subglutinans TaxID=42677 RepID=A0A8H5V7C0_GIBSU|nr:acetylglutamate kinase n-acetyl-gamma-glutamyl-phosphate reductase precursor (ARG-6) [Fusarium subglutinans]KAF5611853.1 acetylglutamate kinase n-acetyl-gamma-glutamyl-phosphate reductase precursor (ARG-6) [Fusarium subglutinans]
MLPTAAAVLRASVRPAASRTLTRVSAPTLTSIRCLNRALSTTHALAAASSLNRDRAREIVAQTISNIGSKRETAAYLKVFTLTSQHFAVIKVGGAILQEHLDEFCGSILLLYELGLYPVIVHGAGPQLNSLLESEGVVPQFEDGIRVTDEKTLTVARKLFLEENLRLIERLDSFGVATRSIQGAFGASYLDKDKWGYVGKVTEVRKQAIESSISAGYIPILTSMAEGDDGHLLNVNADVAAAELAHALKPLKVIYLSEKGGLFDGEGKLISQINLDDEFDTLMAQPWCRYGTRLKIVQSHDLLNSLPRSSSVAIIHPGNLQKELFTDSGAGTLIRLGNRIQKTSSIKELKDIKKLEARPDSSSDNLDIPAIVDQFASILTEKKFTAYYDDAMHCMAIIMPQDQGMAILTSLSTTKSGWLNGTMENIFTNIRKDYPTLAWAVSERDENLTWFFEQADGSFHENGRVLFYYGSDMRSVALSSVYENFVSGRASLGDSNLESGGTA